MRRSAKIATAAAATLATAAAGAFAWTTAADSDIAGPHVLFPGDGHAFGAGYPSVKPGETISFGSIVVCLDKPGTVTIDSVTPTEGSGMKVTAFALRPSPLWHGGDGFGDARSTLSAAGFTGSHTLTLTCDPKTGRGAELGIQAQKTAAGNARSSSWQVGYSSASGHGQVTIPMVTVFCAGADVSTKECAIEF